MLQNKEISMNKLKKQRYKSYLYSVKLLKLQHKYVSSRNAPIINDYIKINNE